jgi:hypothetical protein
MGFWIENRVKILILADDFFSKKLFFPVCRCRRKKLAFGPVRLKRSFRAERFITPLGFTGS